MEEGVLTQKRAPLMWKEALLRRRRVTLTDCGCILSIVVAQFRIAGASASTKRYT